MIALLLTLLWSGSAQADKPDTGDPDQVDHLALAALLVSDGHLDRALSELGQVDLEKVADTFDHRRYWTLTAVIHIRKSETTDKGTPAWAEAATALERALDTAPSRAVAERPSLAALLARCRAELNDWPAVLAALTRVPADAWAETPTLALLRARALIETGDREAAYKELRQHLAAQPEASAARRMLVFLLVDLGLYRAAAEEGEAWAQSGAASLEDQLAIAESLRHGRAFEEGLTLLERLRLKGSKTPGHVMVAKAHARMLADHGRPLAGAELLARAASADPSLTLDAAELYRRAGRPLRALELNARVLEQPAKMRQRLGILMDLERYEEVVAMAERLTRLELDRDDLAYAVAYAAFMTGRFALAERWLVRVTSPALFERAGTLRATMARCKDGLARCE